MSSDLISSLENFFKQYNFNIDREGAEIHEDMAPYELEEALFYLFNKHGVVGYAETGTTPCIYLPSIIETILQLLAVSDWKLSSVDSDDEWQTADVSLQHDSGKTYSFTVLDIDNSDWVPGDIFVKMQCFSEKYCANTFRVFFSDDPYRLVAMPNEAAAELEEIISTFT